MAITNEEWPDVVYDEVQACEEYERLSEAVGELTASFLDLQIKGLLVISTTKVLRGFLMSILANLE